jgi:hypothetical protein
LAELIAGPFQQPVGRIKTDLRRPVATKANDDAAFLIGIADRDRSQQRPASSNSSVSGRLAGRSFERRLVRRAREVVGMGGSLGDCRLRIADLGFRD